MARIAWGDDIDLTPDELDDVPPARLPRAERRKFNRRRHALMQLERAESHWLKVAFEGHVPYDMPDAMRVHPDDPGDLRL